jgi:hypothetical protein
MSTKGDSNRIQNLSAKELKCKDKSEGRSSHQERKEAGNI